MEIEALVGEEVEPPGPLTAAFSASEPGLNPAWTGARAVPDRPVPPLGTVASLAASAGGCSGGGSFPRPPGGLE